MVNVPSIYVHVQFIDQFGLKAIEYHTEGGSDISLQLSHGGQVNGEGGTRVVYVPVPGKRSCSWFECITHLHCSRRSTHASTGLCGSAFPRVYLIRKHRS